MISAMQIEEKFLNVICVTKYDPVFAVRACPKPSLITLAKKL